MSEPTPLREKYRQSLVMMLDALSRKHVLNKFWRQPNRWPSGDSDRIFFGEAVNTIGRALYDGAWTGSELSACSYIERMNTFGGSLVYHFHRMGEGTPTNGAADIQDDLPTEPDITPPITQQEIGKRLRVYHAALVQRFPELEEDFEQARAKWQTYLEYNRAAQLRLTNTLNVFLDKVKSREITTYLRIKSTQNTIGDFFIPSLGFWNTGDIINDRMRDGHVTLDWDFNKGKKVKQPIDYYVFISRPQSQTTVSQIDQPYLASNEAVLQNYPYLSFMLDAAQQLKNEPINDWKIESLAAWLSERAPPSLKWSAHKANMMATLLRMPAAEKGGAKRQVRKTG